MRKTIGTGIEHPVGQTPRRTPGQWPRRAGHLRLKERGQGRRGQRTDSGIELFQQGVPLLGGEHLKVVQRHLRRRHQATEQG